MLEVRLSPRISSVKSRNRFNNKEFSAFNRFSSEVASWIELEDELIALRYVIKLMFFVRHESYSFQRVRLNMVILIDPETQ